MNKILFKGLKAGICILLLLTPNCLQPVLAHAEDTFKIGWIGSLSGPLQKYGAGLAAQIAVDDLNNAGGILGHKVELIQEDTQGQSSKAITAFIKLHSQEKLRFIVGGHSSPESLPIAPLTRGKDVLTLAAISSSPKFTDLSPHSMRVTQSSRIVGIKLAKHAYDTGHRRAAVIGEITDYVIPVAEEFKHTFESLGGKVLYDERFSSNETDFRPILTKLIGKGVQAIYIGCQSPDSTVLLVQQMHDLGITASLYGNEIVGSTADARHDLETHFKGLVYAEPAYTKDAAKTKDLISKFKARYQMDELPLGIWTAEAYDAVMLLGATINRCGDNVEKVRECLLKTKNYEGASGLISIDAHGDGVREYLVKRKGNRAVSQCRDKITNLLK